MFWLITLILLAGIAGYLRLSLQKSMWLYIAWLVLVPLTGALHGWMAFLWFIVLIKLTIFSIEPLRIKLVSKPIMKILKKNLPPISPTEKEALESGDVWWDAELFSGKPNWQRLRDISPARLTQKEKDFLNNQTETLCQMIDDWQITHELYDLPPEVWDYIKKERFFGMVIPEEYDGLGFSALAHSNVIMKVASRSITAAVTIMVPNSLGPGQLLLQYGTEEQKDQYLKNLAVGKEVPCFALTGPEAGSDASSIPDSGVVCEQDGVLGIQLNWEKRYITLGPVATLLGLAFHLYDPDHLIGDKDDVGISLALIPTNHKGVEIGQRHFPLDMPFQNGPNFGKDVFIPMDWLIGGQKQAGHGWQMLVECLGEGRGISLPALSVGGGKLASRITGAYARIRTQFGLPIGKFEGVEMPLARILGNTYIMEAGRRLTLTALDQGNKPAIITALLKYQLTERMRHLINDAMDIQGGSGICLGPSNYIGRIYQSIPIAITVEGANILTRNLIVFGQGAIRGHPYLYKEMQAVEANDLTAFDDALVNHSLFIQSNFMRSIWFGLTGGIFETTGSPCTRPYYRHLTRLTANFALLTDYALLSLGGGLKRKERLSGRFADILSNLYLCSAVLKHFENQGEPAADLPLLDYACTLTIHRAQQAILAVIHNLPLPYLAKTLRFFMFPFGKPYSPPNDKQIHKVADIALHDSPTRDRLTQGIYSTDDPSDRTGRIEAAFHKILAVSELESRVKKARKLGEIQGKTQPDLINDAKHKKLITADEAEQLQAAWEAMRNAIAVDAFEPEYFKET